MNFQSVAASKKKTPIMLQMVYKNKQKKKEQAIKCEIHFHFSFRDCLT